MEMWDGYLSGELKNKNENTVLEFDTWLMQQTDEDSENEALCCCGFLLNIIMRYDTVSCECDFVILQKTV